MRFATDDPFLAAATRTIVDQFAPERIVLFGSRARGDHQPESDYDLIVVLESPLDRGERDGPIRDAIQEAGRSVDVTVYTPAEFDVSRHDVGALAFAGETEGQILYDRNPSRWPRHVREKPRGTPPSLAGWVARAESDFATRAVIFAGSPSLDTVAFHAHQAAEKFLKAALVANHVPPPRTHRLADVLARSATELRDDPRLAQACTLLDDLWPKMRYPNERMPTLAETEAATAAAGEVRAAALRRMESR